MGRPKVRVRDRRRAVLSVRLSVGERELLEGMSGGEGDLSDTVRMLLDMGVARFWRTGVLLPLRMGELRVVKEGAKDGRILRVAEVLREVEGGFREWLEGAQELLVVAVCEEQNEKNEEKKKE